MKKTIYLLVIFSLFLSSCSIPVEIISKSEGKWEIVENNIFEMPRGNTKMNADKLAIKKVNIEWTECIILRTDWYHFLFNCNWK